jgi:PHD/YefM family antitoxin component YafN of YafNO toxin-antitoxin module
MAHATIRKDGKEFVLVPKSEYRRLTADDRRDARKARQALAKLRAGKLRTIGHDALKRQLGL